MKTFFFPAVLFVLLAPLVATRTARAQQAVERWHRLEHGFTSSRDYDNPLYDVKKFSVQFTSPSGRTQAINGFWDGGRSWKVRFAPDEPGRWTWTSVSSDSANRGLNGLTGDFTCNENTSTLELYRRGSIEHPQGSYHLRYSDGTPFFWTACTAWNGTLKSTPAEWNEYLSNRAASGYNVIQFVTTQWRGGDKNSEGQVAFEGSGRISLNPAFFRHLDGKIDEINKHGLVAAPVLLWALGSVQGRELSPGYYLPESEAIMLARYMVARYGGHQVIWILGGDGKYVDENEQRWKNIGRGVFGTEHPGVVALHPGGGSWIGEAFVNESWLDMIGYQSGHSRNTSAVDFINKGPAASKWHNLPPKAIVNMEPVYEEIQPDITATDIRNAGYWSVLSTPVSGITYGANGIWPWLREGEVILNHGSKGERASRWNKAIHLPGSVQTGYLGNFMRSLAWWTLMPAPDLLLRQPGKEQPREFVSVSASEDGKLVVAYLPKVDTIRLHNRYGKRYTGQWFNPVTNATMPAQVREVAGVLLAVPAVEGDAVLLLTASDRIVPASRTVKGRR